MKVPSLNFQQSLLLGTLIAITCLALLWGWKFGGGPTPDSDESRTALVNLSGEAAKETEQLRTLESPANAGYDQMVAALDKSWKQLKQGMAPVQAQKLLEEMTTLLWTGDPTQVGAAFRAFLDTGRDASTGLPFRVGEGCISLFPSLRVALLDLLERLDFGEAADYAEVIVGRMNQADEVAVALRTLLHVPDHGTRRLLAVAGVGSPTPALTGRRAPVPMVLHN